MLAIKFKRIGKKHQPSFRVIVAEKRSKVNGRFIDDLGWYNPKSKGFALDKEKTKQWLGNGAQPTASIHNFLVKAGALNAPKIAVHKIRQPAEEKAKGEIVETKEVKNEEKPRQPAEEKQVS